jgi:hypothetical protein
MENKLAMSESNFLMFCVDACRATWSYFTVVNLYITGIEAPFEQMNHPARIIHIYERLSSILVVLMICPWPNSLIIHEPLKGRVLAEEHGHFDHFPSSGEALESTEFLFRISHDSGVIVELIQDLCKDVEGVGTEKKLNGMVVADVV